jgi:hypothetical protein
VTREDASSSAPAANPASLGGDARKLVALLGAVVAPATLVTALAYYFGWRRERAFAGYFGIDPTVLDFSTSDYVLRSVDALFVPVAAVLLVVFAALCVHVLFGDRLGRLNTAPLLAALGLGAIAVGIALAAGHPVASSRGYLQALGPGVGAVLVAYAVVRWRSGIGAGAAGLGYLAAAVALVSLFWATSEYADTRGRGQAERLALHLGGNPHATVFSKDNLNIDPLAGGSGLVAGRPTIAVTTARSGAYRYRYDGFVLLVRTGGKYFLTPAPAGGGWDARNDSIFVLPDDTSIRIEFSRGRTYPSKQLEGTISPVLPAFTG